MAMLAMSFGVVLAIAAVVIGLAVLVVVFTRNGTRESNKRRSTTAQQRKTAVVGDYRLCPKCNEVIELTKEALRMESVQCPSCGVKLQLYVLHDEFYVVQELDEHLDDAKHI